VSWSKKLRRLLPLALLGAAVVPGAAHAATPGINYRPADVASQANIDRALATGAQDIRMFVDWSSWEPGSAADFPPAAGGAVTAADNQAYGYLKAIQAFHAANRRVMLVVTNAPGWANGGGAVNVPPTDPQTYAQFAGQLVGWLKANGAPIQELEVWNEPDGDDPGDFWAGPPDPGGYTKLLTAAYPAIKAGDPNVAVYTGPTVGNDFDWIAQLYAQGAKGSFDGVSVHTDTSCLDRGPDQFYRDAVGRLDRFTFLGYRSVHDVMAANGDGGKPIAMSELGWSSTGGAANSCTRGAFAGQKPDGVSTADQAKYLAQAFGCLANDPYVTTADWFEFEDETGRTPNEFNHYGLYDANGAAKPSLTAFKNVAAAGGGGAQACGDFTPPTINVISPTEGQQFVDKLDLKVGATDNAGGVGVGRISAFVDASTTEIRNWTGDALKAPFVGITPWQGSGKLALGPHKIRFIALDMNGNTSEVDRDVVKVDAKALKATLTPKFKVGKKVKCKGRTCTFSGSLSRVKGGRPSIGGKVAVEWQFKNKKGKWRKLVGGLKPASKSFTFKAKLKNKGKWRVRVTYAGQAPWKKATSTYRTFTVK
jgi:hypothetical protein